MKRLEAVVLLWLGVPGRSAAQCADGAPPPCPPPAHHTGAAPAPATSLAVLYFDNLSTDSADAYLADGLTEEITSRLGDVSRLRVTSRFAMRRFRAGAVPDLVTAGRELGVRYLVEGSVRHAGDRVRVSTRLIDARSGFRVWGDDYDRGTRDVLALQEDIAREVAIQIAGRLLPAERTALASRRTRNPEAYDHFLRGNYFLARRTPGAIESAITEYRTAIRLDSRFPDALGRIAYCYALQLDWDWPHPGVPAESLLAGGFTAAARALELDSTATDAWMARGLLLAQRNPRTLEGVNDAFARAIALEPDNAEAWHQHGWYLAIQGDTNGAIAAHRRALTIEPDRAFTRIELAWIYAVNGQSAAAASLLDSAVTYDPSSPFGDAMRAIIRLRLKDTTGAVIDARAALRLAVDDRAWGEAPMAFVEASLGDTVAARARAELLATAALATDQVGVEDGWLTALALMATGQNGRAIDVLERVRPRAAHLAFDMSIPELAPLRVDPRFRQILAEARWPGPR